MILILLKGLIPVSLGISPLGDPKVVVDEYYTDILNANYKVAYESLLDRDKGKVTKEEYVYYMELAEEISPLKN
ncbi:hypothetical protein [Brevibacillus daliensis]|uniref:hypothetical protein n=1 Tax=Brevibacillus daliensis TaxID=2892995 RepID=UPI001E2C42EE|nr:hypothetical protein [Brevibacillus daliensis]